MLSDKSKAQNSVFCELHFSVKEGRSKLLVVFQNKLRVVLVDVFAHAILFMLTVLFPSLPIEKYLFSQDNFKYFFLYELLLSPGLNTLLIEKK